MPNLTTPFPEPLSGGDPDVENLWNTCRALIRELRILLNNLDESNCTKAASVDADKIDTRFGLIKSAQIQSLSADKLSAGTIDTNSVTISGGDGSMELGAEGRLTFYDNSEGVKYKRVELGKDDDGKIAFTIYAKDGETKTMYMDEDGNMVLAGILNTTKDIKVGGSITLRPEATGRIDFGTIGFITATITTAPLLSIVANNQGYIDITAGLINFNGNTSGLKRDGSPLITKAEAEQLISQHLQEYHQQ